MKLDAELRDACRKGDVPQVTNLLEKPFDINVGDNVGWNPFLLSCYGNHSSIVEALLKDKRINVNYQMSDGSTALHVVCEFGKTKIFKLLITDERVNVTLQNNLGATPFYVACASGYIETVKLLLNDPRVNINTPNHSGVTPLIVACQEGHKAIVELLLKDERIEVNSETNEGMTAFIAACELHYFEIFKLLLNHNNIDVDSAMKDGRSAIFVSTQRGYLQLVKWILANGKEINLKRKWNENHQTVFHHAKSLIHEDRQEWESKEEVKIRQKNCRDIMRLLGSYLIDPIKTRIELRKDLVPPSQSILQFPFLLNLKSFFSLKKVQSAPPRNIQKELNSFVKNKMMHMIFDGSSSFILFFIYLNF